MYNNIFTPSKDAPFYLEKNEIEYDIYIENIDGERIKIPMNSSLSDLTDAKHFIIILNESFKLGYKRCIDDINLNEEM